jgi:hypothetical protein
MAVVVAVDFNVSVTSNVPLFSLPQNITLGT